MEIDENIALEVMDEPAHNARDGIAGMSVETERNMKRSLLAGAFLLASCFNAVNAGSPSSPSSPSSSGQGLVVHEWGTFTSMYGSDGKTLPGLYHEEERLPSFVYGRNREAAREGATSGAPTGCDAQTDPCACKCMERSTLGGVLSGVTQKLETPVLYFYADGEQEVEVHVRFPGGILSEWYPKAAAYAPALGEWRQLADGMMRWRIRLSPGAQGFPSVPPEATWALARGVGATPVTVGEEREEFIFYRGLGAFEPPFKVQPFPGGALELTNLSAEPISAAFLLHVHEGGGGIVSLGSLMPNAPVRVGPIPVGEKERSLEDYAQRAMAMVQAALEQTGLTPGEAQAMVRTWSDSYFRSRGTRILYVLPRSVTDALLPIDIQPRPSSLVRTLVGRAEVLTVEEEQAVLDRLSSASRLQEAPERVLAELGRFAEPKLRRAMELLPEGATKSYCADLLSKSMELP